MDKPYEECEEMKEAHISEFKGFENYYVNIRGAEVAEMENEKNFITTINYIDVNERRAQE